jgi:hypothetical protein
MEIYNTDYLFTPWQITFLLILFYFYKRK